MSIEVPTVDPQLKKDLVQEGFEGDDTGGAAVIIGKIDKSEPEAGSASSSEAEHYRQQIESEGRAPDAASYIKLHKEIAMPNSAWAGLDIENIKPGGYFYYGETSEGTPFYFIDKDKNIALVKVDFSKIGPSGITFNEFFNEVDALGFYDLKITNQYHEVSNRLNAFRMAERAAKLKKDAREFNF